MTLETWLAFVAASFILLIIPGPTILLVLSYALSKGKSVALASVAGVALGDFVAMSLSLAGLGALVATSAALFTALKWIGAIYLIWLGTRLFRSAPLEGLSMPRAEMSSPAIFRHNALVTALNPKSIAFFIAFVPQFIDATRPVAIQFVILIATFVGLATANALAYALAADRLRNTIERPAVITLLTRAGGFVLIGMGLLTATLRRSA